MASRNIVDLLDGTFAPSVSNLVFSQASPTVTLSVPTSGSALVTVVAGQIIRFTNNTDTPIGVSFGTAATLGGLTYATAMDILPGSAEAFCVPYAATRFKAISPTGTLDLKYTIGVGA
jgi:hypothetical protein